MERLTSIVLALILTFNISAQKVDSVYQYIGYKEFGIKYQKIEMYDELPARIKDITSSFITGRFGDYSSRIKFVHAQIFAIDSAFGKEITALKMRNVYVNPIPYVELNFAFTDTCLGIIQYGINIEMDQLGQVIGCNFPNFGNKGKKINAIQRVKEFSDSIMLNLNLKLNKKKYKIDLTYNREDDILIWHICYIKSEEINRKDYHCLLINAHYNTLINEHEMLEVKSDYNCCDTGVNIDIKNK